MYRYTIRGRLAEMRKEMYLWMFVLGLVVFVGGSAIVPKKAATDELTRNGIANILLAIGFVIAIAGFVLGGIDYLHRLLYP